MNSITKFGNLREECFATSLLLIGSVDSMPEQKDVNDCNERRSWRLKMKETWIEKLHNEMEIFTTFVSLLFSSQLLRRNWVFFTSIELLLNHRDTKIEFLPCFFKRWLTEKESWTSNSIEDGLLDASKLCYEWIPIDTWVKLVGVGKL